MNKPYMKKYAEEVAEGCDHDAAHAQGLAAAARTAPSGVNTTAHLNRARVKRTALEIATAIRPANKFTRVGASFVERIEAKVRAAIREEVRCHPSKGKTLL